MWPNRSVKRIGSGKQKELMLLGLMVLHLVDLGLLLIKYLSGRTKIGNWDLFQLQKP